MRSALLRQWRGQMARGKMSEGTKIWLVCISRGWGADSPAPDRRPHCCGRPRRAGDKGQGVRADARREADGCWEAGKAMTNQQLKDTIRQRYRRFRSVVPPGRLTRSSRGCPNAARVAPITRGNSRGTDTTLRRSAETCRSRSTYWRATRATRIAGRTVKLEWAVTGLVIYFSVAFLVLRGTLL